MQDAAMGNADNALSEGTPSPWDARPLAIPHMLESSQVLFFVFLHLPVCSVRHRVCAICFCRSASALVCHQDSINSQTPTPSEQEGALVQVSARW